jgi:hypothetical protein
MSTNNGTTWTAVNTGLANLNVNALTLNGNNIYASTRGGIFISTNNGVNWAPVNIGLMNANILSLAFSNSHMYAGTSGSGIWKRPLNEIKTSVITPEKTTNSRVYPNPATTEITVETNSIHDAWICISDLSGKELKNNQPAGFSTQIDISDIPAGLYFLQIREGNKFEIQKLIKQD